ncbi:MAG TPA: hypothetical protein VHF24_03975 [Acidimicrobiales bacterium]|nr:hypothetical protein [Acidimicrobiales bacterium]
MTGSAMGASGSVSLFGGPPIVFNPTPTVTLPSTGGNEVANAPSILFEAGPADLLTTGNVDISTQGATGAGGSVTSSASLDNVLIGGIEIAELSSTCTANEGGTTGSATVSGGRLVTQDPDPNVDGDEVFADIPANPAPNTSMTGVVPGVGDTYTVVFNEQTTSGGVLTVNAAHLTLMGPNATGDVIIGQSVCGVTAGGGGATTTTVVDLTTTTAGDGVTTTTAGPGVTTTTAGPGVTTTVCPPTACPTTTVCPTPCPTTVTPLVRTGSESDLTIAWAALALTLGGLLLMGVRGVPGAAADGPKRGRRDDGMP